MIALAHYYAYLADSLFEQTDTCLQYGYQAISVFSDVGDCGMEVKVRNGINKVLLDGKKDTIAYKQNNLIAYQLALRELAPDDPVRIKAANNHAILHARLHQDYRKSLTILENGFRSLRTNADPNLRGGMSYNIGSYYFRLGDFRSAVRYYDHSLSAYREDSSRLARHLIVAYTEKGRALLAGQDLLPAITVFRKGVNVTKGTGAKLSKLVIRNLRRCQIHLAEALRRQGDYPAALTVLTEVSSDPLLLDAVHATALKEKVELYVAMGRLAEAENSLRELLAITTEDRNHLADRRYLQARLDRARGYAQTALAQLDQGIEILLPGGPGGKTPLEDCPSLYRLIALFKDKAAWIAADTASLDAQYQAWAIYRTVSEYSDYLRAQYQSRDAQLLLLDRRQRIYPEALAVLHRIWKREPRDTVLDGILYFMEKSKSTILLDDLRAQEFETDRPEARNYFDRLYRLEKNMAHLRNQLRTAEKDDDSIRNKLLQAERKWRFTQDSLTDIYPAYAALTRMPIPGLEELRGKILNDTTALISYLLDEDWVYRLRIGPGQSDFTRLPRSIIERAELEKFIGSLRLRDTTEIRFFEERAWRYQRELIDVERLSPRLRRIILLPDAGLSGLPFACLLRRPVSRTEHEYDYLVGHYDLQQAYSAAALLLQQNLPPKTDNQMAGFYPIYRGQTNYQRGVEASVDYFRRYAGEHYRREQASLDAFRENAGRHSVLLFAGHAGSAVGPTAEPGLLLADTILLLSQLAGTKMNADLAILSACETGVGKDQAGEGIMSMARGFTQAGVKTTIMSLWLVAEEATLRLVRTTLEEMSGGKAVVRSLCAAQRAYLRDPGISTAERAPYYWAGMTVVGAEQRLLIQRRTGPDGWLSLVLGGIGLGCAGIFWWKRRQRA